MENYIVCPRCGQDYLQNAETNDGKIKFIACPECDALWLNQRDFSNKGEEGKDWFSLTTYLESVGQKRGQYRINWLGKLTK